MQWSVWKSIKRKGQFFFLSSFVQKKGRRKRGKTPITLRKLELAEKLANRRFPGRCNKMMLLYSNKITIYPLKNGFYYKATVTTLITTVHTFYTNNCSCKATKKGLDKSPWKNATTIVETISRALISFGWIIFRLIVIVPRTGGFNACKCTYILPR